MEITPYSMTQMPFIVRQQSTIIGLNFPEQLADLHKTALHLRQT